MSAAEVGQRLCDLCSEGKHLDAIDELYGEDVVSVEAAEADGPMPRTMSGKQAVRGKTEWWGNSHEVHSNSVKGPFPHGDDRFAVLFELDATNKEAGQRFQMTEVAVYTVDDGKITREEFFYAM